MNEHTPALTFSQIELKTKLVLEKYVEFCFLLGSAATLRFHKESDVDLAVFWNSSVLNSTSKDVDFDFKLKILNELEEAFHRDIDLVSLNNIDVIYAIQVIETGKILINNNPGTLLEWKAIQLSKYPDFKRSRSIIEKNILKRKKYV
jgi:predicted nucleotidyltransferase